MPELTVTAGKQMPAHAPQADPHTADFAAVRAFALNPAFRSAEGHELLFTSNPFHRPVRPNDLAFVQFDRPLADGRLTELSALMGQRILLNLYESSYAFICDSALSDQARRDAESFYSDGSRHVGEAARPFLERHLFRWIDGDEASPSVSLEQLLDDQIALSVESTQRVLTAIGRSTNRVRMARFAALQLCGPGLSRELVIGAWSCVDWSGGAGPVLAACAQAAREAQVELMALASACELPAGPHACWQFYLGTSMGTANFIHRCTRDPRRLDEALGAVLVDRLRRTAIAAAWRELLTQTLEISCAPPFSGRIAGGYAALLRTRILELLAARAKVHGDGVLHAAARGIAGMGRVWRAADEDLRAQCAWAGHIDHHRALAVRYMDLIRERGLHVDMETYDELSTERSTTHVHDTDRLLVIDSGEMDFWHSHGPPIHLVPGDMLFVPRHRLHGSVVTSERCAYHQPVITPDLARRYAEFAL